ncbi:MAG: glycosyltransferase family 4 protein [Phycisphaerae bacterium]
MRKLLILNTDLELGGTPRVVEQLARRLRSTRPGPNPLEVHVACLAGLGPVGHALLEAGIPVTALDATGPAAVVPVVARLAALVEQQGIDTMLSFLVHANAVAAAVATLTGVKHLQSIQTTQPEPAWHWRVQGLVHRASSRVIVPSASIAEAARRRAGIGAGKLVLIPNAVDLPAEALPVRDTGGEVRIGFLGRLDPVKRVPLLVHAMRSLPMRYTLHIFGDGPARRDVLEAASGLHRGQFTHHGYADRDAALAQLDVLVLPSLAEGCPMVLLEAMAAGVPVVGTDAPGIRDVIEDGVTGLLTPPGRLAEALRQLGEDALLRRRLAAAARRRVADRFTWQQTLPAWQSSLKA